LSLIVQSIAFQDLTVLVFLFFTRQNATANVRTQNTPSYDLENYDFDEKK